MSAKLPAEAQTEWRRMLTTFLKNKQTSGVREDHMYQIVCFFCQLDNVKKHTFWGMWSFQLCWLHFCKKTNTAWLKFLLRLRLGKCALGWLKSMCQVHGWLLRFEDKCGSQLTLGWQHCRVCRSLASASTRPKPKPLFRPHPDLSV